MGAVKVSHNPMKAPELIMGGKFLVPGKFTLNYTDNGSDPDFELQFEVRDGAPQCRSMKITSHEDGGEIQGKHLRMLRLEDWLEIALSHVAMVIRERQGGEMMATPARDEVEMRDIIKHGRIARTDSRRAITDTGPTRAVAEHFDKSLRTASLYVKQAREKGHLGKAIKGKAGEQ
jgi:hypothetical protein